VIPGGLLTSPYEILDYRSLLILHDPEGMHATFARKQSVRLAQDGVVAILDHAWGHGVLATDYENSAGRRDGSYKHERRRHFVVGVRRRMASGDILPFRVRREARAGFLKPEGWLETTLDHPIAQLRPSIVFPKDRPCRGVAIVPGGREEPWLSSWMR